MLSTIVESDFSDATEAMRLQAIRETGLRPQSHLPTFDRLTRLMRSTFGCEMAVISFVEAQKNFFLSRDGITAFETLRETSFCDTIVASNTSLWVKDARTDRRFQKSLLVNRPGGVCSYLGVPLVLKSGVTVGAVWVGDSRPGRFKLEQTQPLNLLAEVVSDMISAHMAEQDAIKKAAMLDTKNNHLLTVNRLLKNAESVAGIGSWSVSTDLQDLVWSPQTYILHEMDPSEKICVRDAVNFYKAEDRQKVSKFLADSLRNHSSYEFDATIITAKGNERKVRARGDYIKGSQWVADRIVGVIQAL
ncbi:MAG: GAF domain-containing protein [Pseudomonadota bacterium]